MKNQSYYTVTKELLFMSHLTNVVFLSALNTQTVSGKSSVLFGKSWRKYKGGTIRW